MVCLLLDILLGTTVQVLRMISVFRIIIIKNQWNWRYGSEERFLIRKIQGRDYFVKNLTLPIPLRLSFTTGMVLSLTTISDYYTVSSAEPGVTSYVVRISQSFMERNLEGGGIFRLITRGVETSYTPETGSPH